LPKLNGRRTHGNGFGLRFGEAVLKVCLDHSRDLEGNRIHESHSVGRHGNCVNFVDEAHSSNEKLYVWTNGCLRSLEALPDDYLPTVEQLLQRERKRRQSS
jgi:xanthine dehydrogenase iron-sulfur cluster and FAD-binding subunit A